MKKNHTILYFSISQIINCILIVIRNEKKTHLTNFFLSSSSLLFNSSAYYSPGYFLLSRLYNNRKKISLKFLVSFINIILILLIIFENKFNHNQYSIK